MKEWFVEKKGVPADDTLIFFPEMRQRESVKKPSVRPSRTVKKVGGDDVDPTYD